MANGIYFIVLTISGVISLLMFLYAIFQIGAKKIYIPFAFLSLGIAMMSLMDAFYYGLSPIYHYSIMRVEYIFINMMSISWIILAVMFTEYFRKYLTKITFFSIVLSLFGYLGVLTNPYHHLFYKYSIVYFRTNTVYGPWFWYNAIINYVFIFSGIVMVVIKAIRNVSREHIILAFGIMTPLILNILYIFRIVKTEVDLTAPALLVATAVFLYVIILKQKLENDILDLDTIMGNMQVGFIAFSDNSVIAQNRAVGELLSTERRFKKISEFIQFISRERAIDVSKHLENALASENTDYTGQFRIKDNDKVISIDIKSIYKNGKERGKIAILNDLSRFRNLESLNVALREMNAELKHQKEKQSRILGRLSHDLMTPITSIEGYLKYVLDGKLGNLSEKQKKALLIVDKNMLRLQKMLENVLLITKLETASDAYNKKLFDLKVLLIDLFEERNMLAVEKEFDFKLDINLKEKMIFGDREKIHTILDNLLDNAFKYTEPFGEIVLFARNTGNNVVFGVKNTGKHISNEDIERITEPFVRLKSVESATGVGLGLAIVKSIVKAHNGEFNVESLRNGFNVFSVSLPQY